MLMEMINREEEMDDEEENCKKECIEDKGSVSIFN